MPELAIGKPVAMNIRVMKCGDALLGRFSSAMMLPPELQPLPVSAKSLLIIRPGGIGDAVLLAPAVRQIRNKFPDTHISVLAEKRNAGVFAMVSGVDRLLCYDRPGEFLEALRGSYDVVIDTEQWHRLSAVVARLVKAPVKIGFDTNERRRMFTHALRYSHDDYETVSFGRLLEPCGIDAAVPDGTKPWLRVPDDAERQADSLLDQLEGKPFITIFPGASIPERRWGAERFRQVADMVFAAMGVKAVVIGGGDDSEQGGVISAGGAALNLVGKTSLAVTAAVIRRSALLVSGDSGVLHIAVGLGVPTVSLFGPGRALKWAPRGDTHIVINKGLPCSPCTTFGTTPSCHDGARCMKDISVDEVFNAAAVLLTAIGTVSSRCCKRDWIVSDS